MLFPLTKLMIHTSFISIGLARKTLW